MIAATRSQDKCCRSRSTSRQPRVPRLRAGEILKTKDGRLLRSYGSRPGQAGEARLNGYLDDYAYLVHGLLALHDATADKRWLDEARALTDTMVQFHSDKDAAGFFYTSNDHEKLFARAKDQYDGAQRPPTAWRHATSCGCGRRPATKKYRALAEKDAQGVRRAAQGESDRADCDGGSVGPLSGCKKP